jgi:DNA polymerase-3 subunit beta
VKFRSERDALIEMLATAGRAVGARATSSPVLSGILLVMPGNTLSVTGTDLDLTIQVTEEVIGMDDGTCVVPARLSTDIVRRLEPGAVTFAHQRRPHHHFGRPVELQTTHLSRGRVPSRRADRPRPRPNLPEAALSEAVRQVVRAASHDDARPLLTGVLLSRSTGSIRMVATDSYRMALRDLPGIGRAPR